MILGSVFDLTVMYLTFCNYLHVNASCMFMLLLSIDIDYSNFVYKKKKLTLFINTIEFRVFPKPIAVLFSFTDPHLPTKRSQEINLPPSV